MRQRMLDPVKKFAEEYANYRSERISLIASENIASKLQLASNLLGLSDQYCSRLPHEKGDVGNLSFGNLGPLDNLNEMAREEIKKIFNAEECDIRLLSGLSGLTVLLFSLIDDNDILFKVHDLHGGHLAVKPIAKRLNARMHEMKLGDDYRLDLNDFRKNYERLRPKVIFLDSSYCLFPYPVEELRRIVGDDTVIIYDASHVAALIAASKFQDPFSEGADIIHSTTHKTFWGPQKSIILFKKKTSVVETIQHNVKNVLVSNTHLHHILSLLIATIELKTFGRQYADALVKNNVYFASRLDEIGFDIVAKDSGYTESNQFWINFGTKSRAIRAFQVLEDIHISTNVIFLPGDMWGLRIGTNELTRLGATKATFEALADVFYDAVIENESKETLLERTKEIKSALNVLRYSFDDTLEGAELIELFIAKNRTLEKDLLSIVSGYFYSK